MYNKVILEGRLTRDIEVRYTQGGRAIGNTGIAINNKYKTATGEQKEEVMFIDLTFFGKTAEIANQYLRKGRNVLVDGSLKLDQWTAQDGSKKSKHTVSVSTLQMLGGKDDVTTGAGDTYSQPAPQQNAYNAPSQPTPQAAPQQAAPTTIPEIDINEDEIPF